MSTFEPSKFQINYPLFISLHLIRLLRQMSRIANTSGDVLKSHSQAINRHKITFLVHRDWHQIKSSSFHVIPVSFCCYSDIQFIAFLKYTMNTVCNNFPPSSICHLGFHDFYTTIKIQQNG